MPKPLDVDWPLIQTLYTQGATAKEVSLKTGVSVGAIATRASRANWRRLAAAAKQNVSDSVQDAVASASSTVRNALAEALVAHVNKLPKANNWKEAAKMNSQLEPLVRNAKTVFGWSESQSQPLVRIQVLSSASCELARPEALDDTRNAPVVLAPSIDVDSLPQTPSVSAILPDNVGTIPPPPVVLSTP